MVKILSLILRKQRKETFSKSISIIEKKLFILNQKYKMFIFMNNKLINYIQTNMTLPNSRRTMNLDSFPSTSTFNSYIPSSPFVSSKRFSRKRDSSTDSLNGSRVLSNKGLVSPKDSCNGRRQSNSRDKKSSREKSNSNDVLQFIKSTSYIKTPRENNSQQDESSLNFSLTDKKRVKNNYQRPQTDRKQKHSYNNCTEINYKILNSFNTKNKTLNMNSNLTHSKTNRNQNPEKLNTISRYGMQLKIENQKEDTQLQLQIKNNEILILEDEQKRLKKSESEKNKRILNLQKQIKQLHSGEAEKNRKILVLQNQVKELRSTNSQYSIEIQKSIKIVKQLIEKYSHTYQEIKVMPKNKHKVQRISDKKLSMFIRQELSNKIQTYFSKHQLNFQHIISDLRSKVNKYQSELGRLQIRNSLSMKYMVENEELKNQNYRAADELLRIKNRYKSLQSECNTLRISNARLRKSITQLKIIKQKELKQIRQRRKNQGEEFDFSFEKQHPNLIYSRITHIQTSPKIKTQSETQWMEQAENNMSFNISDVSTEELMEFEDFT